MTELDNTIEQSGKEWEKIRPIQHLPLDSGDKVYKYRFGKVHIEDIDDDVTLPDGAEIKEIGDGYLIYQYKNRTPVLITTDNCYVELDGNVTDAEKQAYHCVSILDGKGLVSNWRKL